MKTLGEAIWSVFKRFTVAILSTLGILTLFGYILDRMEIVVNSKLYESLGRGTVLFTAIIGTPLHEIAHWLGCILFGFKVHNVELLRPIKYKSDGILGFVQFSYKQDNLWQKLGCFIVGIAPMLMGSIFILLFMRLLKPEIFIQIKEKVRKVTYGVKKPNFFAVFFAGFGGFWKGLFSLKKWGWLRSIICIYIAMSIAMHMTISSADIESAKSGMWIVLTLYVIFAIVTAMIGNDYVIPGAKVAAMLSAFFSIGLIADVLLLVLSILFSGVGNFKGLNKVIDSSFINSVNLNKYVEVIEEGYDHYGTVSISFDEDKFLKKYGKKINKNFTGDIESFIDYYSSNSKKAEAIKNSLSQIDIAPTFVSLLGVPKSNKTSDLSNGDVITLSWDSVYGNEFLNLDELIKAATGLTVSHKDFTYEVKKLKIVDTFDPFDSLAYSIEGISGAASFLLDTKSVESDDNILFSPKYKDTLCNGDKVTVKARINDLEAYATTHNRLPYPLEKEYEVSGLPYYAVSISEVDNAILNKKNKEAEEIALQLSANWVEECRIESVTCVGNMFLSHDDQRYKLIHNIYLSIIKIHVNSDLEPKLEFDYYYPVEFKDFLISEGKSIEGINSSSWNVPSFEKKETFVGSGDNVYSKLSFKGYEKIEDIINAYSNTGERFTIIESNVE